MRLSNKFWVAAVVLIAIAGIAVYLVLTQRKEETVNLAVEQCQALDHLIQVQEYLVSTSRTLNDREKELRVRIYENFRDEQQRRVSAQCRDPLDPDVIVAAVREAEGP